MHLGNEPRELIIGLIGWSGSSNGAKERNMNRFAEGEQKMDLGDYSARSLDG